MAAQKPIRRATERNEAAIRTWLDHDYPAIVKRAKKEKAEIHWADETGISNQANYGLSTADQNQAGAAALHIRDNLHPDTRS